MKKKIALTIVLVLCCAMFCACSDTKLVTGTKADNAKQKEVANELSTNQATPTDIDYSLERYNLIRRAYWVNGQREKANMLVCEIEKPLGYIVLFAGNAVVGRFVVDGKVTSLNSFLTPDYSWEHMRVSPSCCNWGEVEMADVDGSYGENDNGIFFFTINGNYIEWTGEYLYSDIPFEVETPVVKYTEVE